MASPSAPTSDLATPRLLAVAETIALLADLEELHRQNLLIEFEDEHGVRRFAVRELP